MIERRPEIVIDAVLHPYNFSLGNARTEIAAGFGIGTYAYLGMTGDNSNEKGIAMRRRWPDRVMFYGTLDPLRADAVETVEHLAKDCGACGIKLYPENWHHTESRAEPVLLDAPNVAPVLEKVLELGVRSPSTRRFRPGMASRTSTAWETSSRRRCAIPICRSRSCIPGPRSWKPRPSCSSATRTCGATSR